MKHHQYIIQLNEKKKKLNFENSELKAVIINDWKEISESLRLGNLTKQFVNALLTKPKKTSSNRDEIVANWKTILKNLLRKKYMNLSSKYWEWLNKKLFSN